MQESRVFRTVVVALLAAILLVLVYITALLNPQIIDTKPSIEQSTFTYKR